MTYNQGKKSSNEVLYTNLQHKTQKEITFLVAQFLEYLGKFF